MSKTNGMGTDDPGKSPDVHKEPDNETKVLSTSGERVGKENEMSESQRAEDEIKYFAQLFNTTSTIQPKLENGTYTEEFRRHVLEIHRSFHAFDKFSVETARESKTKVGKILITSGCVKVLCDTVIDLLETGTDSKDLLVKASSALMSYTDHVAEVTYAVRDHGRLVPALLKKLLQWMDNQQGGKTSLDESLGWHLLGIPHNLALRDENVAYLRRVRTSDVFMLYLETESEKLKLLALTTLADIVTDEEAKRLATSPELTQFLLDIMRKAIRHSKHLYAGWTLKELLRAVAHLARNDANKLLLVEKGALPLLLEGIECQLQEERDGSMKALWALSLHKDNAKSFLDDQDLLDLVVAVYQDKSQSETSRRAAEGILWQLRHELQNIDMYKSIAQAFSRKTPQEARTGHVMLSYQWANQPLVKRIHDLLQENGFKVWMDIHEMGYSTRQSMAERVENAFVVLCCMSAKYKDSPRCRQEVEYADDLRKPIVPLKMERDYKPDGWLGLMIAGRMFYDFSGKYPFDRKFQELIKAISDTGSDVRYVGDATRSSEVMRQDAVNSVTSQPVTADEMISITKSNQSGRTTYSAPAPYRSAVCDVDRIRHWSRDDVQNWLNMFDLSGELLDTLTGEQIAFLHRLRSEAPEFFYRHLMKDLCLKTLQQLLQMTKALDDLPTVT